jgi:hypothetical protein
MLVFDPVCFAHTCIACANGSVGTLYGAKLFVQAADGAKLLGLAEQLGRYFSFRWGFLLQRLWSPRGVPTFVFQLRSKTAFQRDGGFFVGSLKVLVVRLAIVHAIHFKTVVGMQCWNLIDTYVIEIKPNFFLGGFLFRSKMCGYASHSTLCSCTSISGRSNRTRRFLTASFFLLSSCMLHSLMLLIEMIMFVPRLDLLCSCELHRGEQGDFRL